MCTAPFGPCLSAQKPIISKMSAVCWRRPAVGVRVGRTRGGAEGPASWWRWTGACCLICGPSHARPLKRKNKDKCTYVCGWFMFVSRIMRKMSDTFQGNLLGSRRENSFTVTLRFISSTEQQKIANLCRGWKNTQRVKKDPAKYPSSCI